MDLKTYMSADYFPLTTQPGLTPEQQLLIDAVNYDQAMADEAAGVTWTPAEVDTVNELKAKHAARDSVMAQLKGPWGSPPAPHGRAGQVPPAGPPPRPGPAG